MEHDFKVTYYEASAIAEALSLLERKGAGIHQPAVISLFVKLVALSKAGPAVLTPTVPLANA